MSSLVDIPVDRVAGLWPRVWIAVGSGFSREELKSVILDAGYALTADAITSLTDVASKILTADRAADRAANPIGAVLGSSSSQEALRRLVADRRILAHLPEIKRLRRQTGFFRKLDRAIQAGRMASAHPDEEEALTERLLQRLGAGQYRPLRDEVRLLARAYEAWLEGHPQVLWDAPRLLREATACLASRGWPEGLGVPEEILYFTGAASESLERAFCEELGRHLSFKRMGPLEAKPDLGEIDFQWERWHTLDDAADSLADRLLEAGSLGHQVVLIPDDTAIRRSLKRAFDARGIVSADARDPNRLRLDETLKWALLPLELVSGDFERVQVLSWLRTWPAAESESVSRLSAEISARGIRQGLMHYAGGLLVNLHARLSALQDGLGGKKSLEEISRFHLDLVREGVARSSESVWVLGFFERLWDDLSEDQSRFDQTNRRAPLRYWLERLKAAIAEAPAPMEPLKAEAGVQVFRLHQSSLLKFEKVWLFGISPEFLSAGSSSGGAGTGDYWYSEREREMLSTEFGIRSGFEVRRERLAAISGWFAPAREVVILDAHYEWDARERESLLPLLREIATELKLGSLAKRVEEEAVAEMGSHPRFTPSYSAIRPVPPQKVNLPPLSAAAGGVPEITASDLDRYSRCAFQALGYQRWKLQDARDPEPDLWPDVKGTLLHQAVKRLVASRNEEGKITLKASSALDLAWGTRRPKGLLRGHRIEAYVKSRLEKVLEVFLEKEDEFQARAGTRTLVLDDDLKFRVDFGDFIVKGTPDRIEESPEGLFVMDYKSSSASPNGTEMIELGYRLQLPFYALAAEAQLKKPVIGVQFVELTRKGSRGSGIFFSRFNGKEPGKLTKTTANSKSLIKSGSPEEVWRLMREQILAHGRAFIQGRFEAAPKKEDKECGTCSLSDLCGFRRKGGESAEGESE
ncbi:MAG: PD-(D/E)XK nuclease family protein [Oligoflexia bacterium]|nr:PD-(D/E)XK nuclease family protein [Oligoflexia bacterium]